MLENNENHETDGRLENDDLIVEPGSSHVSATNRAPRRSNKCRHPVLVKLRMATSVDDIRSLRLWKAVAAEFVGCLLLVLIGCGSCTGWGPIPPPLMNGTDVEEVVMPAGLAPAMVVQVSIAFGLSVATIVWCIGHVSGGHINPAVTAAMLATRHISLVKAIVYILAQLIGAIVGALILKAITPIEVQGSLGATSLSPRLNVGQGFGVEFFVTFVLVLTVFGACDTNRKDLGGSAPLSIGLSVTMCHLFAVQYTGSSMNTARSFGPAVVQGQWENHWVYWVGPIIGGMAAGLIYDNLFAVNASLDKAKAFLLAATYDDSKFSAKKTKIRLIEEDLDPDEAEMNEKNSMSA